MLFEPLVRGAAQGIPLRSAPINPAWIESGSPEASCAILAKADDRGANAILWACTAGKFTWRYDCDETLYILEGGATIAAPGEPARHLGPGDTLHFSRGAVATWTIETHVRKIAFCRSAPPRWIALAFRYYGGLLRRLRRSCARARSAPTLAPV
jgi:uncharacterized cupin superfamily protein